MTTATCLKKAASLLAGGWAEPPFLQMLDGAMSDGSACRYDDEGIHRFTPRGALRAAGADDSEVLAAWELLDAVACPTFHAEITYALSPTPDPAISRQLMIAALGKPMGFDDWISRPNRTLEDLLHVFDFAVLRATRGDA